MGQKKKHLIFGILTEFQVFLAHIFVKIGGGCGIRTHVGVNPNGFQDRLVMTASITLRKRQIRLRVLKYIITKWPYCQERHEKICIFLKLLLQFLACYGIMDKRWWFMPAAYEL